MLSREQLQSYEENGFLIVEDVLDQARVIESIRAEYSTLLDDLWTGWQVQGRLPGGLAASGFEDRLLTAYRAGCDWFQPMDISLPGDRILADTPMHFGPAVFDLITNDRLLDLVEDLIGPEITSNPIQHVRIKPPAASLDADDVRAHVAGTDWHQDRGVTRPESDQTRMVTIWCAISDATAENGCLQAVPARHHEGMLPHCPKRQTAIADGYVDMAEAIPLPVRSGGVVILDPLTPHASLDNQSPNFRWSCDLRSTRTGAPTGRSQFPEFIARSRSNPDRELRSWQTWRDMWRDARLHLAGEPHINLHRWSSDAPFCA